MEPWLIRITDYLLAQSWQIAVLTIAVALASCLLRDRSAHARYLLWLIVLAKALVPPLYSIPVAVLPQQAPPAYVAAPPTTERTAAEYRASEAAATESAGPAFVRSEAASARIVDKPGKYDTRAWLAVGWLVGVVALSFYYVLNALRTQIWLQRRRKTLPSGSARSLEDFFMAHGVRRIPRIWLLERIGQPFVWGLLRGSIYLPAKLLDGKHAKFQPSLLGHEISHVIHLDALVNSLQVVAQTIFWFHPFVWWANAKIRAEREKCCDETTIARLNAPPEEYSEAIVEMLAAKYEQARPVPSLAVASQLKNIEERIKTMLRPGKKFHKRPSLMTVVTVLVFALLTVPMALVLTARAGAKGAPTPLHQAAADGNFKELRSLISKGADINAKDSLGRTPLFYAVEKSDTLMFDLLIAKGADINVKDTAGNTPLHHAARLARNVGQPAAELARRGADVNATNNRRQTPLHVALEGEELGPLSFVVSVLLRYDVNLNAKDSNGKTALHLAAQRAVERENWRSILRRILVKGPDVNLKDAKGWTALHYVCNYESDAQDEVKVILENTKGIELNIVDNNNMTPMHIAAMRGQTDVCETLMNNGAKVDAKDKYGHTPAYYAVRAGNIETADALIKNGADISSIQLSAYRGNLSNLKALLTTGASVNEKDETGFTPLHAAAMGGHREVVEYIVSQGADVEAEGGPGWTALSYAARGNYKEVVEVLRTKGIGGGKEVSRLLPTVIERGYADMTTMLIALGADVNFDNGKSLRLAASHGNKDTVELLISKGADVNAGGKQAPLHAAASLDRIDIAECLIAAGADVNGINKEWWSPLGDAIIHGHKRMVEFLLSKGADVDKGNGWSALEAAIDGEYKEIAMLLIEHGADVNFCGPLNLAAWYEPEYIELLIDNGANVNRVGGWGWTPLHSSVYGNSRDAFDLLVSRGANVNARTDKEETVLHLLIQWGRGPDQVKFVLSRGVDINAADACGWTALHRAVLYNLPEIVKLLIAKGADVNLKDSDGRTPLWLAKEGGHTEIVELLKKHMATE